MYAESPVRLSPIGLCQAEETLIRVLKASSFSLRGARNMKNARNTPVLLFQAHLPTPDAGKGVAIQSFLDSNTCISIDVWSIR